MRCNPDIDIHYLYHPEDIVVEITPDQRASRQNEYQKLGLICQYVTCLPLNTPVTLRVPAICPDLALHAVVTGCTSNQDEYELNLAFTTPEASMSIRMIEQLCQIKHYRRQLALSTGIELSEEQAAQNWIRDYAALFPRNDI